MKASPLQLTHSHFSGLSIVALDVEPELIGNNGSIYPDMPSEALEVTVELGYPGDAGDAPHEFLVKVGISSSKSLPDGFPYRFAAQIEGIFTIDHDGDFEERKRMIVINGGSMLFGIVREQILALSLRHKNGPLLLPSLDFRDLGPTDDETPEEGRTSQAGHSNKSR